MMHGHKNLKLIIRLSFVFNYNINNQREVTAVLEEGTLKTGTDLSPTLSGLNFNTLRWENSKNLGIQTLLIALLLRFRPS